MEEVKYLDMTKYKRRDHFQYFQSLAFPYVGITCDVDITQFQRWVKENHAPFFLSFLWCVSQAANRIPEFRQRIIDGKIAQYTFCKTSHTVAKEDGTYSYCTLDEQMPMQDFLEYAVQKQEQAKEEGTIEEDDQEAQSLFFISTLPWLTYTSLVQPTPIPADSNPRITWGKFYERDNRILMPVSVLCHHALVDGSHIAAFYKELDTLIRTESW